MSDDQDDSTEWRCEECDAPWIAVDDMCHRCGNRTRIPVDRYPSVSTDD